jgi:predicted nucleic acid-binding protein
MCQVSRADTGDFLSRRISTPLHPVIKERVGSILMESDVAINGIIELELLGGAKSEQEYERLKKRLDDLSYIEAGRSLWDSSSRLAYDLKRKGVQAPYTDIFIAASAIQEGAVLLHADSHFDAIAKHSKLRVESLVSRIR